MQPQPNIPQHVAIIMDGNGRWAERRGFPRIKGHEAGVQRVEEIIRVAPKFGVKYLTFYTFSKENWNRPKLEVDFLMSLLSRELDKKLEEFKKNNVIFKVIGRIEDLSAEVQKKIERNIRETSVNTGLTVIMALSYSSRLEIVDACRALAEKAMSGTLKPETIDEKMISDHLYTRGIPDPDLLIRTSGEMRISNFLLWQISYSEFYVTEKCWPEFDEAEFGKSLQEYQKRDRRFGLTAQQKVEI